MIRLIRVELTRLRWRRAVVTLLTAGLLIPLIVLGATLWNNRPVTDGERREAARTAAQEADQPFVRDQIEDCEGSPEDFGVASAQECEAMLTPQPEWFLTRQPLDVAGVLEGQGTALPVIMLVLLLLAGATYVGADWATGSMSNQLLFEPRRGRVWAAKAIALVLVSSVIAVSMQALFYLGIRLAESRWAIDTPAHAWDRLDGIVLRGTLIVVGAAVLGFALTTLFRSTVATLGILFGAAVVGTFFIAILGETRQFLLPPLNLQAFIQGGAEYYVGGPNGVTCTSDPSTGEMSCTGTETLTLRSSATYLGTLLVASVVASLVSFRRRDIP